MNRLQARDQVTLQFRGRATERMGVLECGQRTWSVRGPLHSGGEVAARGGELLASCQVSTAVAGSVTLGTTAGPYTSASERPQLWSKPLLCWGQTASFFLRPLLI